MKYIRTPIGIYDLENSVWFDFDGLCKYHISHCEYYENNPDECRVSNSLEKLCDDFVGLIKSRSSDFIITKVIAHSLKELKDSLKTEFNGKTYQSKFDIIYGCIWTDKGLIYVAKMDDKGELELI